MAPPPLEASKMASSTVPGTQMQVDPPVVYDQCPVVEVSGQDIVLGDRNGIEGITVWTKEQFSDFIEAAKNGKFDKIIK